MTATEQIARVRKNFERIDSELSKIIVGQQTLTRQLFTCICCGGHALIEGVPGLGKTLLVRSLGRVLDLEYSRIQFTPDLMPADILGTNIVKENHRGHREFEFYKGPIFGQLILADEINRASPKTQSALLEAMQENHVTVFGKKYSFEPPFMVLATQNPIEMEGTYPLPEAQIDRFFFKLKMTYPDHEKLSAIIDKTTEDYHPELKPVVDGAAIRDMQSVIRQVPIATHVKDYAIRLTLASHPDNENATEDIQRFVLFGASPRGAQSLILAAKVNALLEGRFNVSDEDINAMTLPALRHRIVLNIRGETEGVDTDDLLGGIVSRTCESN